MLKHWYPPVTASHLWAVSSAASSPLRALHMLFPLILGPATPIASSLPHFTGAPYSAKSSLTVPGRLYCVTPSSTPHTGGAQPGSRFALPLPLEGHLAMSGNAVGCYDLWGGRVTPGLSWVETRDVAKSPTVHRTAPQQSYLAQCQLSQDWGAVPYTVKALEGQEPFFPIILAFRLSPSPAKGNMCSFRARSCLNQRSW